MRVVLERITATGWAVAAVLLAAAVAKAGEIEVVASSASPVYALARSQSGSFLAWSDRDNAISVHRLSAKTLPREVVPKPKVLELIGLLDAQDFDVRQAAFRSLAEMGRLIEGDLQASLEQAKSREVVARIEWLLDALAPVRHEVHRGPVLSLAITADEQTVVSAGKDGTVRLWSVSDGKVFKVLRGHREAVWAVACSPVHDTIASGGADHVVRLWSGKSGRLVSTLRGHGSVVHDVEFSADGRFLASTGSFDKTVLIWEVAAVSEVARLPHEAPPLCVAFSPDGQQLATAGYDGSLQIWNATNGQAVTSLRAGSSTIRAIWFNPELDRLICGDQRGMVHIWRISDRKIIQSFADHGKAVRALCVSDDGHKIFSAGLDGQVVMRQF